MGCWRIWLMWSRPVDCVGGGRSWESRASSGRFGTGTGGVVYRHFHRIDVAG
jgi:hypothetical protein